MTDLDELVDQMLAPATRLVCAVQDFDPAESHAVLESLTVRELHGLAIALAALVPDDQALEVLLAWTRNEGTISPRKARVNRTRLLEAVDPERRSKRSAA